MKIVAIAVPMAVAKLLRCEQLILETRVCVRVRDQRQRLQRGKIKMDGFSIENYIKPVSKIYIDKLLHSMFHA